MKPGDMHQHDEPTDDQREVAAIIATVIVWASGVLAGVILTAWWLT